MPGFGWRPVYLNYMKVAKTMEAAAAEYKCDSGDIQAVKTSLDRHWNIEDITGRRLQGYRDHQGRERRLAAARGLR